VLYEMLAGEPPYTGSSAQAVIAKRLSEPVPHVRTLREVSQAIEQVVTKALAKVPADRFATAAQFALALRAPNLATGRAARHWIRTVLAGSGVAILIAAGGALALAPRSRLALVRTLLTRKAARLDARRVVVAPFDNETGDSNLARLGDMAADWITRGLNRTSVVEVVDGRTALVTSRIVEQTPRLFRTGNRARALAEETGAGTVVWGNYYRDGDSLRFEARVTDVASGRVMRTIEPVNGRLSAPAEVVDRLRQRVVASLAVIADTVNAGWASPDEPPSYEAYQETVRGVSGYFRSDTADAFRHLRRAVALDSSYVTPLIALAYTHDIYRQWDQVDSLVRRAERYRAGVVPAEQAWLDLLNADLRGEQSASLRAARELLRLSPSSAEYAILVALNAVYQNRPWQALAALSRLDPQRGALLGPPGMWYWVHLTDARHELGSYEPELEDARRGLRQFPEALLLAYCEERALAALGRVDELEARRRSFASFSARPGLVSRLQLLLAREVRAHGYRAQAIRLADHLVSELRSAGADTSAPKSVADRTAGQVVLASALYLTEHWDDAHTVFAALATQDSNSVTYESALGAIAARRGDRREAERIATSLANVRRSHLFGINTYGRAAIAALLGEREKAVTLLRDAEAQGLRAWSFLGDADIHTDMDFESLRDYPPFLELVQPRR
jgi:TolB-like protein/predicted Zn-dependent protease